MPERRQWRRILDRGAAIVREYASAVTLRQLFYRLFSEELLPNTENAYKGLSHTSAAARRAGWFPPLVDQGREIHRPLTFIGPADAWAWLVKHYRRDRPESQAESVYLGAEKATLVNLLDEWYGDLGVPIVALRGYGSQTYMDDVVADVERQARPAVLLYVGDHDPSGEDIERDFLARTNCFTKAIRVAVRPEHVAEFDLPPAPGKASDSRARGFQARHGRLIQVEVEALAPDVLRGLVDDALGDFWDMSAFRSTLATEEKERRVLESWEPR